VRRHRELIEEEEEGCWVCTVEEEREPKAFSTRALKLSSMEMGESLVS
jgi:hypothetical protein